MPGVGEMAANPLGLFSSCVVTLHRAHFQEAVWLSERRRGVTKPRQVSEGNSPNKRPLMRQLHNVKLNEATNQPQAQIHTRHSSHCSVGLEFYFITRFSFLCEKGLGLGQRGFVAGHFGIGG